MTTALNKAETMTEALIIGHGKRENNNDHDDENDSKNDHGTEQEHNCDSDNDSKVSKVNVFHQTDSKGIPTLDITCYRLILELI